MVPMPDFLFVIALFHKLVSLVLLEAPAYRLPLTGQTNKISDEIELQSQRNPQDRFPGPGELSQMLTLSSSQVLRYGQYSPLSGLSPRLKDLLADREEIKNSKVVSALVLTVRILVYEWAQE